MENKNFYDEIVKSLKEESGKLNKKLTTINNNNGDYNSYIAILKSLRETLDLIHKYDWHLSYSEYYVLDDNDKQIKQISIWEQNYDNDIRNHKFWNVGSEVNTNKFEISRDINNKPIYEGSMVKSKGKTFVVRYDELMKSFVLRGVIDGIENKTGHHSFNSIAIDLDDIEVVENI
jgi:hypothetical protein